MNRSLNLLVGLVVILVTLPGFSQHRLHFEHLSTKNGLSHNQIFSICQDREGFMWIGTADGLNKYDGYTFTVYKPDPGDPNNHMGHNMVWDILETRSGELWFATPGEGIHHINKRTGQINYFRFDPTRQALRNICYTLTEDRQGFLWVGSEGGLNRFDPRTKQFRMYQTPVEGSDKRIWSVLEDRFGTLWVGTSNGLFTLDHQTGKFIRYPLDLAHPGRQHLIEALYQSADNTLWVASKGVALYRLEPVAGNKAATSDKPVQYRQKEETCLETTEILPNGLEENTDHTMVIGTVQGLIQLNPATGNITPYLANPGTDGALSHNFVWAVSRGRQGTFWVGTSNGIDKASILPPKFTMYQAISDQTANVRLENNITSLFEDKQGIIWFSNSISLYTEGFFRLDRRTNHLVNYTHKTQGSNGIKTNLSSNNVTTIYGDQAGTIWVATPEGLHALSPASQSTGQLTHYPANGQFTIIDIAEDQWGKLWLGGKGYLAQFDPKTGHYTYYQHDPANPNSLGGQEVTDVLVSRSGIVWVAIGGAGVSKLNPATGQFTRYNPAYSTQEKILFRRDVLSLYEASDGAIWVTTNIGGIFRIDPKTDAINTFTKHDGLPDNHVISLMGDEAGMLWLTTNKGLCRFNPVTKEVRIFDEKDGLQGREFTRAFTRGPTGELVVGCTNGFEVFHPGRMRNNPYKPPVYITRANLPDSVHLFPQSPLKLTYQENVITFNFVALNYIASGKNQYAYQLEGVNNGWVYCGTQRTATYSFLAPGEYIFRVKAANNDGVWNEKGTAIHLIIAPPWWRTWWAYGIYSLLTLLGIWSLIQYRSRQLRQANRVLEEKVAQRTEEVIHQKQEIEVQRNHLADALTELKDTQAQLIQREKLASLGELTAGIAHEIQNPLNFVNNFATLSAELISEVRQEETKSPPDTELIGDLLQDVEKNLQKISHHGNRASSIVKGMLEHTHTSTGERYPTDLNALADEYLRLAYHGQRAKDQTFNCKMVTNFDPDLAKVNVVSQDISRVLLNLFNNAFYAVHQKQLKAPADYQPMVTVSTKRVEKAIEIRVLDNGTGMPERIQQKVFQPFFTTKPTGQGTGLGLSLSYDIITKGHGGRLTVESQEDQGTEFIIQIPVNTNDH